MIIFLLILIAIGVLMLSHPGKVLLHILAEAAAIIVAICLLLVIISVITTSAPLEAIAVFWFILGITYLYIKYKP